MPKGKRTVQYAIAYAVAIASVAAGALASWPALAMPKLKNKETDIQITTDEISWMVAMTSPGYMTGSFLSRFVADRFGRKISILVSALPITAGTIVVLSAKIAWLLCLGRFLWGVGGGLFMTVVSLYLAEIADKEIRGSLTLVTRFMFSFGSLLVMCIGPFVSYATLNYLLLALPLIYFLTSYFIPESPYFWLKEGKVERARKVLMTIRNYEDEKILEDDLLQMKSHVRKEMVHASTLQELFTSKKYRKAVFIAAGLKLSLIFTGQNIIIQYMGLIILESGSTINLALVFIIFGAVQFCTSIMSSMLADRLGRRPLLIYSYLGSGIALIAIAVYFFYLEVLEYDRECLKSYSFIPFAGIIACNIISTLGYYSVTTVVPAEIFPMNVKAIAMTSFSMFGGFLNFSLARGYQLLKDVGGLCGVFSFLSVAAITGFVFSVLYVPETKGKSLREIQEQLQGALYETEEDCSKLNPVRVEVDKERELGKINRKEGVSVKEFD